jgi:hypothetical protein
MQKQLAAILIILGLGVFSWAQAPKDFFDGKKSQAELEIMKGILNTTISYVTQGQQTDVWRFNTSGISAYYLYGQGVVFEIPTSGLRRSGSGFFVGEVFTPEMSEALQQLRNNSKDLESAVTELAWANKALGKGVATGTGKTGSNKGTAPAPPSAPTPPAPPSAPAPPAAPTPPAAPAPQPAPVVAPNPPAPASPFRVDREELRKKIDEYQAMLKKSREDADVDREKFLKSLNEIKGYLIEALANYGDSLTTVKPNEYINLILSTDNFDTDFGRRKPQHDVISAQKSWITDYKAGRLSLEGFKQKVLQYTE